MLFEMILMKFDAHELIDADSFLGPFSFSLFILLVVFVCLSMFVTIINDSFRFVRDHQHNEYEHRFGFTFYRFRRWIGMLMSFRFFCPLSNFPSGHQSEAEIIEERDEQMRQK